MRTTSAIFIARKYHTARSGATCLWTSISIILSPLKLCGTFFANRTSGTVGSARSLSQFSRFCSLSVARPGNLSVASLRTRTFERESASSWGTRLALAWATCIAGEQQSSDTGLPLHRGTSSRLVRSGSDRASDATKTSRSAGANEALSMTEVRRKAARWSGSFGTTQSAL